MFFLFHANLARFQFQRCILSCTFRSILDSTNGFETHRTLELLGPKSSPIGIAQSYLMHVDMFSMSQLEFFVNHPFRTRTHAHLIRSLAAYINGYGAIDFTASLLTNIPKIWSLNPWSSMAKPIRILRKLK